MSVLDEDYGRLAREVLSGRMTEGQVAWKMSDLAWDGHLSGAAQMARAWFSRFPPSLWIRRLVAWYMSRASGYRLLPIRVGDRDDVAVDEYDPDLTDASALAEEARAAVEAPISERGGLLVIYVPVRPHRPEDTARLFRDVAHAARRVLPEGAGLYYNVYPVPSGAEAELPEFDA